jgi:hypothetical protein
VLPGDDLLVATGFGVLDVGEVEYDGQVMSGRAFRRGLADGDIFGG